MARLFTAASSEKINLSLGAGASLNTALTLAAIVRPTSDGASEQTIFSVGVAGGTRWELARAGTTRAILRSSAGGTNGGAGSAFTAADGFTFICAGKGAGTVTPRFHKYFYATNTWVHTNGGGTLADVTPATSSSIGALSDATKPWDGDIAIAGAWATLLTDAQVERLAYDLSAWFQIQPNGLWLLDQAAITIPVNDFSGGGAHQTAITGTSVSTSPVPVFSYGAPILTPTAPSAASTTTVTVTVTPVTATQFHVGKRRAVGHRSRGIRIANSL